MKEFNLEEAKAGKPVCTRDGRKARIVCFDDKCINFPIIAAIEYDDFEQLATYKLDGRYTKDGETDYDLMMVTKHEGWVNLYKSPLAIEEGRYPYYSVIYETEENAKKNKDQFYIATTKIEWEE